MRVLSKGRKQKGWARELHCTGMGHGEGGCMAFLLVERADLFRTTQVHQSDQDHFVSFLCPECGVITDMNAWRTPVSPMDLMPFKQWAKADERDAQNGVRLITPGELPPGAVITYPGDDLPKGNSFNFNGEERRT